MMRFKNGTFNPLDNDDELVAPIHRAATVPRRFGDEADAIDSMEAIGFEYSGMYGNDTDFAICPYWRVGGKDWYVKVYPQGSTSDGPMFEVYCDSDEDYLALLTQMGPLIVYGQMSKIMNAMRSAAKEMSDLY